MANEFIIYCYYFMWTLLVFSSIIYLISGLDDLFFDIYYWVRYSFLLLKGQGPKPILYSALKRIPEKRIAIMIPCWHEAGVIEEMLRFNVFSIEYEAYDIFVGVYHNDPNTVGAVSGIANLIPHIKVVIGKNPGPTTKADNLNCIFNYIMSYEKANHLHYDIFLLQDAEDIIHPLSLKLYNSLIPINQMVQTPVFPLEVSLKELLHWTYSAEFAEVHTKDIIVREWIKALVPSAGVGTGFSRFALELLAKENHGDPFETSTVTEDYSTAYKLRLHQVKQKFVLRYFWRTVWRKKWYFFGDSVPRRRKDFIATRALFPHEYMKSIRQRSRWILGIAIQEWARHGWRGNFTTVYTLFHDRKSLVTYINAGLFFIVIPFWVIYHFISLYNPNYPTLQDRFDASPWVWNIILIATILMFERVLQRGIGLFRVYGFWPMLISPIVVLYGNIINIHALLRTYWLCIFKFPTRAASAPLHWDKTDHEFPSAELIRRTQKLGQLVLNSGYITEDQLSKMLDIQALTGKKLGELFIEHHYLTANQLYELRAEQYQLPLVKGNQARLLFANQLPKIPKWHYRKIITNNCYPLELNGNVVTLGVTDPSNELALTSVIELIKPYKFKFVLFEPTF